jgi:hypothetical protein
VEKLNVNIKNKETPENTLKNWYNTLEEVKYISNDDYEILVLRYE